VPETKASEATPEGIAAADAGEVEPLATIVAALQPSTAGTAKLALAPAALGQAPPQTAAIEIETAAPEPPKPSPVPRAKAANELSAKTADKETKDAKEKESKRNRVAVRTHRAHAAHLARGDAAFELPDFGAPGNWPTEIAENTPAKHRRAAASSGRDPASDAGIGGPFVSAPANWRNP
jgi:hypothetical protein